MLNMSEVLTSVKMDLGIYGMTLPFDNPDEALKDVIKYKTIPTYSIYAPYRMDAPVYESDLTLVARTNDYNLYRLRDGLFGDRKIIIIDEIYPNLYNKGSSQIYTGMDYSVCDYNTMMLNAQKAQLNQFVGPKFSFEFIEPNQIKLYNAGYITHGLLLHVGLTHDYNLSTINEGHREEFMKLVLLDIKRFLYNSMRNYDEIQTAYGTVKLRTDEWSNAEGDRNDLLSRWNEIFHIEGQNLYFL